jgi:hypothetical protein
MFKLLNSLLQLHLSTCIDNVDLVKFPDNNDAILCISHVYKEYFEQELLEIMSNIINFEKFSNLSTISKIHASVLMDAIPKNVNNDKLQIDVKHLSVLIMPLVKFILHKHNNDKSIVSK